MAAPRMAVVTRLRGLFYQGVLTGSASRLAQQELIPCDGARKRFTGAAENPSLLIPRCF